MKATWSGAAVAASFALLFGAVVTLTAQQAQALPAYAAQTGKACGGCHVSAGGGGALNATGKKFQANGHKMK
ncbi:MAG: hypothetical protein WA418_40070 [Bradyrhizobium sp.]